MSAAEQTSFGMPERGAWRWARKEHAFLLRCEGLLWEEVGTRLGLSRERARVHAAGFARRMGRAVRRAAFRTVP